MTDFEVMNIMCSENKDIRMTGSFVSAKLVKQGGHVTMGVDAKVIHDLAFSEGKYTCALYIVNMEQFLKIKSLQINTMKQTATLQDQEKDNKEDNSVKSVDSGLG